MGLVFRFIPQTFSRGYKKVPGGLYRISWHIRVVSYSLIVHLNLVWNRILCAKGSYNTGVSNDLER